MVIPEWSPRHAQVIPHDGFARCVTNHDTSVFATSLGVSSDAPSDATDPDPVDPDLPARNNKSFVKVGAMTTTPDPAPGEGPVRPVSVSLHEGTIAALRARTGRRGMSAYVESLIQRQLERDRLRELIEDAEAEHGPVDQAAVEAKRALLRGDAAGSVDAA
ncbi:hypothetical protein SCOCK_70088 [Actinacidiphila cocklensis]|uniref:Uncharacterized protein n=2 Tax=Actinacidiphila cocklensis TaxID=887465 RepID=A0A9W4EBD8_9ACTN|nr:hypothetical protein SCOCK_70088 [Actinacidiphila cocklensis]